MVQLLRVELARAALRRVFKVFVVLAVLLIAGISIFVFFKTESVDKANRLAPQRMERAIQDCVDREAGVSRPPQDPTTTVVQLTPEELQLIDAEERKAIREACQRDEKVDNYKNIVVAKDISDQGLRGGALYGVMGTLMLVGFVLGATFVGADWRAGTMTTLLLFEPRRVRLALVRLLVCAILTYVFAVAVALLVFVAQLPTLSFHGSTDGLSAHWFSITSLGVLRASAVVAMNAVLGGAIALLARNTAGAIVGSIVLTAIVEPLILTWKDDWARWTWSVNEQIVMSGGTFHGESFTRSPATAALIMVLYLALVMAVSIGLFKHRDIASSS